MGGQQARRAAQESPMRTSPLLAFLLLMLVLPLPALAQPRAPGVDPTKKVAADPYGAPIYGWDSDTDAGEERYRQACVIVLPDAAGGTAVASGTPLPVSFSGGTVEGVVAEGAAASTADPLVSGCEARALGALPAAVHAGDAARPRCSLTGVPYVALADPAGTAQQGAAATPLRVDPTGTTPQPITGNVTEANSATISGHLATLAGTVIGAVVSVADAAVGLLLTSIDGYLATVAGWATGAGDVAADTLQVVQAGRASGADDHVDVDALSETAVLAAAPGRTFARIQVVAGDTDGPICCVAGASTTVCADGIYLDPAPAAGKAGGAADFTGYSGAITCRSTAGTVTVAVQSW
jgi:hypothetical protein